MNNFPYLIFQVFVLFLVLFTMGCVKQHSVQVNGDSLSFYYCDPNAKEILFASSADHFRCHPAIKGPEDVWQVTVPLEKEFVYFYIIDGELTLPDCPDTVFDDFGTKNCLYVSGM
ncbi:MAG: glycogen-binding domain-containing protein [Proteobacteria bacterium]|nr:glycogen-binding domain-containing protein [Pseudomonadota bacterium]MBU1139741.1 glycogen-binding domain-containing protein [Pseudomonadota bacterium]MBU1231962.1 glycogen-binding domain-containing protein [Pseudomonadota bacterium]MBU1418830.1 glycogen-binding domain-containing protein [Pseudomonadota bacterium]MBU1453538.1 glycogen-binding domain-containing protein [Pseudomonadota bacterium]